MINIEYDKLAQIKQIDLPQLLAQKGIHLKHNGNGSWLGLCPFHNDTKPSLSVSFKRDKWIWHCFGCHKSGTAIDFIQALENKSFPDVYTELEQFLDINKTKEVNDLLADIVKIYHNNLKSSKPAQDYLEKRGILDKDLIDTFVIGYCAGNIKDILPDDFKIKESLKDIGILNQNYNETYYNCITIPIFDDNGQAVGLYGRRITDYEPKHLYLKGEHRGVFNCKAAKVYSSIIITEAIIDALSLYKHGFKNVVSSYGTGFTDIHINFLRQNKVKEVFLCFDNDPSGEKASQRAAKILSSYGIETKRLHLPEQIKDINQYFNYQPDIDFKGTKETFAYLLDKAVKIGYSLANPKQQSQVKEKENDFSFLYEDIEYNIHLIDVEEASSLRVVITAKNNDIRHTDKFDLYSQKQRRIFENIISSKFDIPNSKIESDLVNIILYLEAHKENLKNTPQKPIHTITNEDKEKAFQYLKDPHLIENITRDIESIGYIGEDTNKLIAYLVASSRKLKKPLSSIIVSQSATGKSFLMEAISLLMPDEEVEFYSRITPQSLYYMERDQLKNKLLIIDERSGSEEADYAIRSLQTRHKLSLAYPYKDATDGKLKTIVVEMEGPIAFMESSTKAKLNIENTTRSFMLYLDESEAQTKRIHQYQRYLRTLEGKKKQKQIPDVINLHKNIQRLLKPTEVIIDFKNLTFPSTWIRTRRDQERFLCLIEVITYLHQYQRKIQKDEATNSEYIRATQDDYLIAYELSKIALQDSLNDLPTPTKAFLGLLEDIISKKAIEEAADEENFTFRRRDIREWLNLPDHMVKRHMRLLEELEYVNVKRDSKNGYITYTLLAQTTKDSYLEALTSPKDLN